MNLRITAISSIVFMSPIALCAQTPNSIPAPSQFATATTAFIASKPWPSASSGQVSVAQLAYASFYRSLSGAGKYRIVGSPVDAELSMVISADATVGTPLSFPYLRLEIYDTKTHMLLWALSEPINGELRRKALAKNVDDSVAALMNDLAALAKGTIPGDQAANSASTSTKPNTPDEKKK